MARQYAPAEIDQQVGKRQVYLIAVLKPRQQLVAQRDQLSRIHFGVQVEVRRAGETVRHALRHYPPDAGERYDARRSTGRFTAARYWHLDARRGLHIVSRDRTTRSTASDSRQVDPHLLCDPLRNRGDPYLCFGYRCGCGRFSNVPRDDAPARATALELFKMDAMALRKSAGCRTCFHLLQASRRDCLE